MIVVDIECSGVDFIRHAIIQIGAVDFSKPNNTFLIDCHIEKDELYDFEAANASHGKTEKETRDKTLPSQKEALKKFFKWCEATNVKNFMCQNPQFDFAFIKCKAEKYGIKMPVHFRCFDLHSMASLRYLELKDKLLIKKYSSGRRSDMGLPNILKFCGIRDTRIFHNALEDAKSTAECFSRIMYGKNLIKEYKIFTVPKYLR